MTRKDKADYWFKIAFIVIFAVIIGAAGIYTIVSYPFSLLTLLYFALGCAGAFGCGWIAKKLIKEYKRRMSTEGVEE